MKYKLTGPKNTIYIYIYIYFMKYIYIYIYIYIYYEIYEYKHTQKNSCTNIHTCMKYINANTHISQESRIHCLLIPE